MNQSLYVCFTSLNDLQLLHEHARSSHKPVLGTQACMQLNKQECMQMLAYSCISLHTACIQLQNLHTAA